MMILALDLEHTLIYTANDPRPRPGLYDFLERVRSRFDRLVIFTALSRSDFLSVASRLVFAGAVPAWFAELEHFRAAPIPDDLWNKDSGEIMCKDLRRVSEDIRDVLLLDDNGGYVLPGQESRWVRIAAWNGAEKDVALARASDELRRQRYLSFAGEILLFLERRGYEAVVFGSVLRPDEFHTHSDIDIGILKHPDGVLYPPFSNAVLHTGAPEDDLDMVFIENARPDVREAILQDGKRAQEFYKKA